jgi:ATP-dependent DNA helicase Rep
MAMDDEEAEADQIAITLSAHRFERRAKFADYAILYRGNHQARIWKNRCGANAFPM